MLDELKSRCSGLKERLQDLRVAFDLEGKERELAELDRKAASAEFWEDAEAAQKTLKRRAELLSLTEPWHELDRRLSDQAEYLALLDEEREEELERQVERELSGLEEEVRRLEFRLVMRDEADAKNAIVSINPGAGGTESQDWAQMLMRMYLRWAEAKGFKAEVLDLQPGEEAGIKSATFQLSGPYAYGYLKSEVGVHRLVRISPFDAGGRRHTSFASVLVSPEVEDEMEVKVDEADLRIDTFRSSGAGGQHVNVTDSAVRITHLPTGIVVQCQNERSQHKNRAQAMKVLRSRLYDLELKKREEQMAELHSGKKAIAWGSQIRSYILQPYRLVKDHRTGFETGNVEAVLDGELDPFIENYLRSQIEE
ncbi:MAG: peptide chain release factor 2 [Nitrospinota bacterium]